MAQRWEYISFKYDPLGPSPELIRRGQEGFELVSIALRGNDNFAVMKRRIPDEEMTEEDAASNALIGLVIELRNLNRRLARFLRQQGTIMD